MCECLDTSEHNGIAHFVLVHHFVELCFCLVDLVSIVIVDNTGQTVRILVKMMLQRAELVLTPDSAQGETKVLVLHGLHVGTDRCDDRHHLAKPQLEEDRDLSSPLKPNHQDPRHSLASPITRVSEPDVLVASTDVRIILADMHTTCNVKALLADSHQFPDMTVSAGVQRVRELEHPARPRERPGQSDPRSSSTGTDR